MPSIRIQLRTASGDPPGSALEAAAMLEQIGNVHTQKFQQQANRQDIDIAIACHTQASELTPDDDSQKPARLGQIGNGYLLRFGQLGDLGDLDKAIEYHALALSLTSDDHPARFGMLSNLGASHLSRFDRLGDIGDLDTAIECHTRALELLPDTSPNQPVILNNLGMSVFSRFERLGNLDDVNTAIEYQSCALALTPDEDPNRSTRMTNLGRSYLGRFKRLGEIDDLDSAIRLLEDSVSSDTDDHAEQYIRLQDLASSYYTRSKLSRDPNDLEKAIDGHSLAVALASDDDPEKPRLLNLLSISLFARYNNSANPDDLESAILHLSHADFLLESTSHDRSPVFNTLAGCLHARFTALGVLADLDTAIELYTQANDATPDEHPSKFIRFNNLGIALRDRFERLGDRADLDRAIEGYDHALLVMPTPHADRVSLLNNIAVAYYTRHQTTGNLPDLEATIKKYEEAHKIISPGHSDEHTILNGFGVAYYSRYKIQGDVYDLQAGVDFQSRATALLSDGHPDKPAWINNLALSAFSLYERNGKASDLDQSIGYHTQSTNLLPENHPLQSLILRHLGHSYYIRFEVAKISEDLDLSFHCYKRATELPTGPPTERMTAAREWAVLASLYRPSETCLAYQHAMNLLSRIVWLGNSTENRYEQIKKIGQVSSNAATAAIEVGDLSTALEWVEQGRSLVWKQILQLRAPLDELASLDPTLATELRQVARELDRAPILGAISTLGSNSPEQTVRRHHRLAERWDELVQQARSLPGMENFLRPKTASQLVESAHSGAVVALIVDKTGCNALIIAHGSDTVTHISLPSLDFKMLDSAQIQLARSLREQGRVGRGIKSGPSPQEGLQHVLSMLWTDIAMPVLHALGFLNKQDRLPRITWCLGGSFNFLPLHAAGDYTKPGCSLFDCAVSSYTPYLDALLSPSYSGFTGVLGIGQTSTPGLSNLPGTAVELDKIGKLLAPRDFTRIDGQAATKETVRQALDNHNWIHFACHASQDLVQPVKSGFHLQDGALDLKTITRESLTHADLAFLSACETATGDHDVPDESVHLAAGMIVAGFRTTIATMWSINDGDAPLIAEMFYSSMLCDGRPSGQDPARALHRAVGLLRSEVGVKEVGRWAPYIHIGL